MGNKLEECAMALCELEGGKWDARHMGETMSGNDPEDARENYREQARAVISCLMEPSDAMIEAGGGNYVNLERADDPSYEPPDILRAMLQSVLDEAGKE